MSNTPISESQTNSMMAVLVVIAIVIVLVLIGTANPADSLPPQTAESVAQASESLADLQAADTDTQDTAESVTDETTTADSTDTNDEATTDEATTDEATVEDTTTDDATSSEAPTEAVVIAFDAAKAYNISCSACHGLDGQGVADASGMMMGGLAGSTLVSDTTALANFIIAGSGEAVDPATGMPHPILGTDFYSAEEVTELAEYTASLVADAPAENGETDSSSETGNTEASVTADNAEEAAFDAAAAYNLSCAGCHAIDGSGISGLAQPLSPDSALIADANAYLDFLVTGMMDGMTMGMVHPPRGGAGNYDDSELNAIIDYTLTLFE